MNSKKISIFIMLTLMLIFSQQALGTEINNSDKYTFSNYGGEVYTPEPMEFGTNLTDGTTPENAFVDNSTVRKHVLFQFYANPSEEQRQLLQNRGIQLIEGAGHYTYIVSMPVDLTPADLPAESGLRWMGPVPVENKYEDLNVPDWTRTENGQVKLEIHFYKDINDEEAKTIANKYSSSIPERLYFATSNDPVVYGVVTEENNLTSIASEDVVRRIAFYPPEPSPADDSLSDVEQSATSDENQLPGFESLFSIMLLLIVFVFVKRKGSQ